MLHIRRIEAPGTRVTELTLADRLIALAEDAERGGFIYAAAIMVRLACAVFDEAGETRH